MAAEVIPPRHAPLCCRCFRRCVNFRVRRRPPQIWVGQRRVLRAATAGSRRVGGWLAGRLPRRSWSATACACGDSEPSQRAVRACGGRVAAAHGGAGRGTRGAGDVMPGMNTGINIGNPMVVAAFKAALTHQSLIALLIFATLELAWISVRAWRPAPARDGTAADAGDPPAAGGAAPPPGGAGLTPGRG